MTGTHTTRLATTTVATLATVAAAARRRRGKFVVFWQLPIESTLRQLQVGINIHLQLGVPYVWAVAQAALPGLLGS